MFTDLTNKGKYVTFGLKFGADFLAYDEDPMVCHAKYLVKVIESGAQLDQNQLIACERIANQARKDLLIVY